MLVRRFTPNTTVVPKPALHTYILKSIKLIPHNPRTCIRTYSPHLRRARRLGSADAHTDVPHPDLRNRTMVRLKDSANLYVYRTSPNQTSIAKANRFRLLCLCDLSPPNRSKPKLPQRGLNIFFASSATSSMRVAFHRLMVPTNTPLSSLLRSSVLPVNAQYIPSTNTKFIFATSSCAALPQLHHIRRKAEQTKQLKRIMQARSCRGHFIPVADPAHHPGKICCAKASLQPCACGLVSLDDTQKSSTTCHIAVPPQLHN